MTPYSLLLTPAECALMIEEAGFYNTTLSRNIGNQLPSDARHVSEERIRQLQRC